VSNAAIHQRRFQMIFHHFAAGLGGGWQFDWSAADQLSDLLSRQLPCS
jgi:hypothetical protein